MEDGVVGRTLGVAVDAFLRRRPREFVVVGVGVVSGVANRLLVGGGGVAYAPAEVRRLRLLAEPSPGDEKVFPIGLDCVSSGEDGPPLAGDESEAIVFLLVNVRE